MTKVKNDQCKFEEPCAQYKDSAQRDFLSQNLTISFHVIKLSWVERSETTGEGSEPALARIEGLVALKF